MQIGRSNLYLNDRSFLQNWTLTFKESYTEKKFSLEKLRFHTQSLHFLLIWFTFLICLLYLSDQLAFHESLYLFMFPILSYLIKNPQIKRIIQQVPFTLWQVKFFNEGSLGECFGIVLPSFFINFFSLSSWTISVPYLVLDGITMYYINPNVKLNIFLCISTYIIILGSLEKDFRDIWRLYSSTKKTNSLNKALYDNFAGAEFLVNAEGKIIYYNNCALNLIKKLKRPVEILKSGYFYDFFPEFYDSAQALVQNSLKGQLHEELHVFKYQDEENNSLEVGFLLNSCQFTWTSGNCSRIICIDVSGHISKKQLILNCLRDIQSYLEYLNKQLIQIYSESNEIPLEFITIFYRINQHFKGVEAIQGHFAGEIEVKSENFDVHSEVLNTIELLYLKICNHNVHVVYTKEQAVPDAVVGDKALHNLLVFSIFDFVIQNAIEGTEVFILLQVAGAGSNELVLSYKITFKSEKVTNVDIESLFTIRKNCEYVKDLNEIHLASKRFGTGMASVDTILIAIKGYLLPMHSEVVQNKVIINFCVPFLTNNRKVKTKLIQISKSTIRETNLTSKWIPDLGIYNKVDNGDLNILKDQVNLVNSRQKSLKICVQPCEDLKIISEPPHGSIFINSVSEPDLIEGNDVQEKLKNYEIPSISIKKEGQKFRMRSFFSIEYNEMKNLVFIDENDEVKNSLKNLENLKVNIWWAEDSEIGLKMCEEILREGKIVTCFLLNIDRSADKFIVEKVKKLENEFSANVHICGLSFVPADLNYCKLIDVKHFSNFYLVVKPISCTQISALISKLERLENSLNVMHEVNPRLV